MIFWKEKGNLHINKRPGSVYLQIPEQRGFGADGNVEELVPAHGRNVYGHLPAMHFPRQIHADGAQFLGGDVVKTIDPDFPFFREVYGRVPVYILVKIGGEPLVIASSCSVKPKGVRQADVPGDREINVFAGIVLHVGKLLLVFIQGHSAGVHVLLVGVDVIGGRLLIFFVSALERSLQGYRTCGECSQR